MTTHRDLDEQQAAELAYIITHAAHNFTVAALNFGAQCAAAGYLLKQLVPRVETKPLTPHPKPCYNESNADKNAALWRGN